MFRKRANLKEIGRARRKGRVQKKVHGSAERPRLVVFRSHKHLYAQVVDDERGITLASVSTVEKELVKSKKTLLEKSTEVGKLIAERAKKNKISKVVFDRGGYLYHGKIKALADGAREGGLEF
ncbi:MAG: 50S ribosomal protein L18 [Deltaproteobacteria bacterium]|nr:50S ribosomal protein L18 [Deltaproteobacteria bacterium]